ncbi:carboxypeptidase regulatory-like domain-containing protein [Candidatus Latescibacterota bacterium]
MNAVEILTSLDSIGFTAMQFHLSILWQSSIVFAAALILSYFLRKQRSSIRHALWVFVVFAVPLIPLFAFIVSSIGTPQAPIPVMPKYTEPARERVIQPQKLDIIEESNSIDRAETIPPVPDSRENFQTNTSVISPQGNTDEKLSLIQIFHYPWALVFAAYIMGAAFFLLMLLVGRLRIRRWLTESVVITDSDILGIFHRATEKLNLASDFIVVKNDTIESPFTIGTFHPVIMLPADVTRHIESSELYTVALHELSHVRRKDTLTLNIVLIIRALFFFHPLIWIASRHVSLLAENACDYAVIETTEEPVRYAKMLAGIAENLPSRSIKSELAVGIINSKSAFLRRVEVILSHRNGHIRRISRAALTVTAATVVMAVFLALSIPLGEVNEPKEMVTVSGTVVYEGEGVSNADIYLYEPIRTSIEFIKAEKVASTEKDGSFKFDISASKLPATILVHNQNYAVNWISLTENTSLEEIQFEMGIPETVSGYVLDNTDSPIKGAEVKLQGFRIGGDISSLTYLSSDIPGLTSKTNASGNFTINNLPENAQVMLQVTAKGYEKEHVTGITAGMSDIDFSLAPEGRIEGRILYGDTGKPAADITVYARNKEIKLPNSDLVTTDRNGRFTMTNLPPGIFFVFIPPADDFTEWTAEYIENIKVESGNVTENVELRLIKGGIITGRVTDRDTGKPIPGQTVSSFGSDRWLNFPFAHGVTDENGVYRIRFYPGKSEIRMYPPKGYLYDIKREMVDVVAGETVSGIDFTSGRGLSVNGLVLDPDGKPYGNIVISNTEPLINTQVWVGSVRSHDDGTFTLYGVRAENELSIVAADKEKQLRGYFTGAVNPPDEIEIRLRPYETARVEGRILDERGNPFPNVGLMLHVVNYGGGGSSSFKAATTDVSGNYTISNLIIGDRYNLYAEAEGYAPKNLGMSVLDSGVTIIRDAALDVADRWLEGRVTTSSGKPVVGARVTVNGRPTGFKSSISDENGYYRLENLVPATERRVNVIHKDFGIVNFNSVPTNQTRDFEITIPEYHLSGIVIDENGNPVPKIYVTIDPQRHTSGTVYGGIYTGDDGKFRFDNIIDPQVDIRISKESMNKTFGNVETNRDDVEFIFNTSDDEKTQRYDPNSPEARVAEMDSVLNFTEEQEAYVLKMLKNNPQRRFIPPGSFGMSAMKDKILTPLTPEQDKKWRAYETEKRINSRIMTIDNAVTLTEEQKKRIMPILRKEDERMQAFLESYVPTTGEEIRDKLFTIRNDTDTALDSILTEEQMKIYNARLRRDR